MLGFENLIIERSSSLIRIDGSQGEGGGQILRTSLFFSFVLGREVVVENIRAKRDNPGLRPQHLAVIKAFEKVTGGQAENAAVGADWVKFSPGHHVEAQLEVDVGTAGSITLILQTLLPALSLRGHSCSVKVRGGTDTRWSPTYGYFKSLYEPAMTTLGLKFSTRVIRRGYYPAGGGWVEASTGPASLLEAVSFIRGPSQSTARLVSICSRLPRRVAERQAAAATAVLQRSKIKIEGVEIGVEDAESPGTSLVVFHTEEDRRCFLGADSIGEKGVTAEEVGRSAAERFCSAMKSGASVDRNLADMVVPVLALVGEGEVVTEAATGHLRTNLAVAQAFTGCDYELHEAEGICRVHVSKGRPDATPLKS